MTHPTDDELQDLAHSAYEEALSFGLSVDTFLRYFKGIRNRLATQAQGQDAAPAEQPQGDAARVIDDLEYAVLARAQGLPGSAEKLYAAKQAVRNALAAPWPFTGCSGPLTDCDMLDTACAKE